MDVSQEDTNPNSEVLYTVDVDTQKVNIVVDKDTTDKIDMTSEPPETDNTDNTEGKEVDDNIGQQEETQTKTQTNQQIEKQAKQQAPEQQHVNVETMPPATGEQQKPLLKEMETPTRGH